MTASPTRRAAFAGGSKNSFSSKDRWSLVGLNIGVLEWNGDDWLPSIISDARDGVDPPEVVTGDFLRVAQGWMPWTPWSGSGPLRPPPSSTPSRIWSASTGFPGGGAIRGRGL